MNNRTDIYFELTLLKEGSLRRFQKAFFQKYVFTHSYVCGRLLIQVLLNNLPPLVVSGTFLEAEARVSLIHDF